MTFFVALLMMAILPASVIAQGTSATTGQTPDFVPAEDAGTSANWAGYAAQKDGNVYTGVSASWTIPTVVATGTAPVQADATWVGVGGVVSRDLIQAGTQAVVQNGRVQYEAWYELLPDYQTHISLPVHADDSISVSISEVAENNWSIVFVNNTTGKTYQKTLEYESSKSSAEWIQEMPVGGVGRVLSYLPLDDFGQVAFANANATVDGQVESAREADAQALTMVQGRGHLLARPSTFGSDGAGFSVARASGGARMAENSMLGLPRNVANKSFFILFGGGQFILVFR